MPNFDPNELMAEIRNGLRQPHGQDGVIAALEVLGRMREQRAVPLFKEALSHSNNGTRTNAALALYRCGDPAGLAALTKWVSDVYGNPKGAVQAMYKLAEINDAQAVEALRKVQQDHGSSSLMFRGEQRPVSWIVDSLLGSSSEGGATMSRSTGAEQKASSGCFIATAACGDPFSPEVITLSAFRDDVLNASAIGRTVTRFYYATSPPIAAVIARSRVLRCIAMAMLVLPAARVVTSLRRRNGLGSRGR